MKSSNLLCILAASLYLVAMATIGLAGCVGPMISLGVSEGSAGGNVYISGVYFTDGCHDVCINGVCPPTFPAKGIKILFVQGNNTTVIARVDANDRFEFTIPTNIPATAASGEASFVAETLYENRLFRTKPVSFKVK